MSRNLPRRPSRAALVLGVVLVATSPSAYAQAVDLSRIVVVGDSVLAGFASGGLVRRGPMGQRDSAPALIARQTGVSLQLPTMSKPGFPPPLIIVDKNKNRVLDPGEVRRRARGIGFRSQPGRVAHNLAVPGERVSTVLDAVDVGEVATDALTGDARGRDIMKAVIVGLPLEDGSVSQITRMREIGPTFLMVWLGNNDILGSVTRANPAAGVATPAEFATNYRNLLNALADTGAPIAVANIPDVTELPVLRRAAGEVTSCRAEDGSVRPVNADDLLSIRMDRSLLPVPPCGRVLDSAEQAFVRDTVIAFNVEIASAVADVEQRRGVPIALVDAFAIFDGFARQGFDVRGDGSLVLTTRYLGGLFTLDGVHPGRTAHAIIANAFIDAMNAKLGSTIAHIDVASVAARDRFVSNRYQPAGEPPFGLIAKDEDVVDEALATIEDRAEDVIDDIGDRFDDLF
jgi:hypothetical protein